ncbi:MAG: DedA family protein [Candidatus Planktophila sp.]|nr:DedA family protein [Candidatus Planktophila sp.]
MNLFDANSIVGDLGLAGVLAIIFAETGLLVGLAFPGDSLLFIAGVAASGSGTAILGNASLDPVLLFVLSPFAAIFGSVVGYWFGEKYGKKLFDKPDGRIFNHQKVVATEKWLTKYGIGKALVLARFVPFVRTLINPMCGIIGVPKKTFMIWNTVGALIWTQGVIGLGFILGDVLEGSVDKYLLPVIGLIVFVSLVPVLFELFREWQSKRFKN